MKRVDNRPPFFYFVPMECHDLSPSEFGWLRLHLTPGLGRLGLLKLHRAFGSIDAILASSPEEKTRRAGLPARVSVAVPAVDSAELAQAAAFLSKNNGRIVTLWDDHYPPLLAAIHDPPALLYIRGLWPPPSGLAVVGSRRCRPENRQLTRDICREMASAGIAVTSGLARGIDTAAHAGALDGGGHTTAVLGCGIDQTYPRENRRLFQQIAEQGTLISEYPPGTPPKAGHFPARNRIISGLSHGVLVAEAATESGSLITADFALEQGREVFAIPGPPYFDNCAGSNKLLKEGAQIVTEASDILEALWPNQPRNMLERAVINDLPEDARRVYSEMGPTPLHIDDIVRKSGLTPMEVSAILLHLELQGGVIQLPGMHYQRS